MVKRKIEIEDTAKLQLKQAYEYIRKDSLQNAEKVRERKLRNIKAPALNPEQHPKDKFCINNNKNFRAFEIYKYRITYFVTDDKIIIVRIRHTKMNPFIY